MKIYSMTATFGKLENATLTLQPGLNVIEGPNEWGKSTWCAFLVAMLYGIDTRERTTATTLAVKERYQPWSGSPMAGRMDLCWNGRDITIERRTKGRTVFGDFKAYETASGLAVPELTADNCGKLLLGVEKSVFTRTGFVRLSDMPVTQDEALRRRLNDLVTTGDESGQSDDLAQKLRDLKNKVRSNRANGLIPQALAQKNELEDKLHHLDELRSQSQRLKTRQTQVADFTAQLQNHKNTLAWAAAESYAQKAAAARQQLAAADLQVAQLEKACAALPSEEALQAQRRDARVLQLQKENIQTTLAMLPPPPAAPQGAAYSREQAQKDHDAYCELAQVKVPAKGLMITAIIAAVIALAGIILTFATRDQLVLPILGGTLLVVFGLTAAWCGRIYRNQVREYDEARQLREELLGRYAPLPPESWVATAEDWARTQAAYAEKLAAHEADRASLQQQLQQVLTQLQAIPGTEEDRAAALAKHQQLSDARREQQHLSHLVQTLRSAGQLPEKPTAPDSLTYSEADTARLLSDAELETRQLHSRIGQLEGQMQSLGSREALQTQLDAVNTRLARLERTYAALELAQSTLTQAATALQRRFAPAIAQKAGEHLARITGGRYEKLSLTDELTVHTAAAGETTTLPGLWRSDGTVDQLYLALRLAVAEALTPEAPLVLDDALVRFDDARLTQTMALLREAAERKQVILFTCQTREGQKT